MLKRSAPIGLTKYRVPSNTVRFKEPRLGPMSKKTTSYRPASEVQRAEHQLLFLRPPMLPPAASLHAWLKVSSTMESLGWPGLCPTNVGCPENREAAPKRRLRQAGFIAWPLALLLVAAGMFCATGRCFTKSNLGETVVAFRSSEIPIIRASENHRFVGKWFVYGLRQ